MIKFIKILLSLFVLLLTLFVIAFFILTTKVDPIKLKNYLSQEIYRETGYRVDVQGDITWQFYPHIGIKMTDIQVSPDNNAAIPLLQIQKATILTDVLPLLHGKFEMPSIYHVVMNGVTLTRKHSQIKFSYLQTNILLQNKFIKFAPIKGNAYQGELNGEIIYDNHQSVPVLNAIISSSNIDIENLLRDLNHPDTIAGNGAFTMNLKASGTTQKTLLNTLNGDMSLTIKNGVINNTNIMSTIELAAAFFKQDTPIPDQKTAENEKMQQDAQTNFSNLTMTSVIQNGVVTTHDLLLNSPLFMVAGKGDIDINKQSIDLALLATVLGPQVSPAIEELQQTTGGIPLRIRGHFDNYRVEPNYQVIGLEITKRVVKKHANEIKDKIEKGAKKFKKDLQKAGEKLKQSLDNI